MKYVHSLRAVSPSTGEKVPTLALIFDHEPPSFSHQDLSGPHLTTCQEYYQGEAERVVDAMEEVCPGGLIDALLGVLSSRRASQLRVSIR